MLYAMQVPALSYASSYGCTFEEFVAGAAARGVRAVELIPDQTPNLLSELDPGRIQNLRAQLERARIVPTIHSIFYDINPVSVVPEVQDFAVRTIRACAELCRALGGSAVTIHPGYQFPGWRSSDLQRTVFAAAVVRGAKEIFRISADLDIHLYVENGSYYLTTKTGTTRQPLHFAIEPNELLTFLTAAGSDVGACIDVGKAMVSGIDLVDLLSTLDGRRCRFQVGGRKSWTALREAHEGLGLPLDLAQVTYEGSLDEFDSLFGPAAS